ncbi:hypothetical protein ABIF26_006433 [Bradyrhizobium elkanii]
MSVARHIYHYRQGQNVRRLMLCAKFEACFGAALMKRARWFRNISPPTGPVSGRDAV